MLSIDNTKGMYYAYDLVTCDSKTGLFCICASCSYAGNNSIYDVSKTGFVHVVPSHVFSEMNYVLYIFFS